MDGDDEESDRGRKKTKVNRRGPKVTVDLTADSDDEEELFYN